MAFVAKYAAKWGVQIVGVNFQTHSSPWLLPIIKGIKLRSWEPYCFFPVPVTHRDDLLQCTADIQKIPQRHIFIDCRLMFSEHHDLIFDAKRYIIAEIHVEYIFHSDLPDLCSRRKRLLMP